MPKEAAAGSSQNGLVYLKYTFRCRSQFDEPNDQWLDAREATSDELLGAYSKAEYEDMTVAFGARGRKRLNWVFDVIGFVYPYYCFPVRKQGRKRKTATSASSSASKAKKVKKVLTRRPRRIETADVPKLIKGAETAPSALELGHVMPIETCIDPAKEPKSEKAAEQLKVLSPATTTELLKPSSISASTPRKRRMASVLDVVLESVKTSAPAFVEAPSEQIKDAREAATATATNVPAEAGPSETAPIALVEESAPEKSKSPASEEPHKELDFRADFRSRALCLGPKVPLRVLGIRRGCEEDFLYCLPDNKEINCWAYASSPKVF
jgi:hypothetical protein